MVRLGDVASYMNGYAFKPSDWSDTGLPIIRIQDLTGNSYQANRYNGEYALKYEVNQGDVLISWSASLGVYVWQGEKALLNQHIFKVIFDKTEISKSFFVHQVENILEKASSEAHGATMKHLTKPVFDALPFYLPPLDEQRKIAAVLDKVSDLIAKRRQQLDKLDELIKARFVEMFGDMVNNPKAWDTYSLDDCFEITSSKRILKSEWKDSGIPFLRVRDMVQLATTGKVDNEFFISEEFYASLSDSDGIPKEGDILVSATSTLGKCYVVGKGERFYFKDADVLRLRAKKEINPIFFIEQMKTGYIEEQISKTLGVTTVAHFTIKAAKIINMRCPNIELQNQFAAFVEQTEKTKTAISKSLEKLETLKKALMQEYFG